MQGEVPSRGTIFVQELDEDESEEDWEDSEEAEAPVYRSINNLDVPDLAFWSEETSMGSPMFHGGAVLIASPPTKSPPSKLRSGTTPTQPAAISSPELPSCYRNMSTESSHSSTTDADVEELTQMYNALKVENTQLQRQFSTNSHVMSSLNAQNQVLLHDFRSVQEACTSASAAAEEGKRKREPSFGELPLPTSPVDALVPTASVPTASVPTASVPAAATLAGTSTVPGSDMPPPSARPPRPQTQHRSEAIDRPLGPPGPATASLTSAVDHKTHQRELRRHLQELIDIEIDLREQYRRDVEANAATIRDLQETNLALRQQLEKLKLQVAERTAALSPSLRPHRKKASRGPPGDVGMGPSADVAVDE